MAKEEMTKRSPKEEVKEAYGEVTQASAVEKANREEKNTMPYVSASSCNPIGALVPTKLAFETVQALSKYIENGIDTTDIIKEKLGYSSKLDVCEAFASEQVDAIALAIDQIEKGKGFILGDMAGIGKGRVVAGILRYAKKQGKIPVFMTISGNLFSDIYRDFKDIGGMTGSPVIKGSRGAFKDTTDLPIPFIFNTSKDGIVYEESTDEREAVPLFTPLTTKITKEFTDKKKMPPNTDIVLLTYSQLSQDLENAKNVYGISKNMFLQAIAPNSIFVLDESHKGAGDGNIGENISHLLSLCNGVMFASATYSKVPKSMMLYIPKTDIKESKIRPNTIVEAVAENGEAVQEYIASLLVKSGQMIRRDRTFDKCRIDYNYMRTDVAKYYGLYDKVMELYNEIERFSKSDLYKLAVQNAIKRVSAEEKVVLVAETDPKPSNTEERKEWDERNKNKYTVVFNPTNVVKNRFQWIENLLFSIKADYVATQTIELLKSRETKDDKGNVVPNEVEYTQDGKTYKVVTNYKPIIALRNTAEASLTTLGFNIGRKLTEEENDYAKTLINVAESLIKSKMTFDPVNESRKSIVVEDAKIIEKDFEDKGVRITEIIEKMKTAQSGLPLSPIDFMIDKIQSTKREAWDGKYSNSPTFKVEEITKRSRRIAKTKDGYEVVSVAKQSVADRVGRFNSGQSDVIILNTSGSTGLSLHSYWKFTDKRPRAMLIHQVELDVATETQKRGRINRTGQVNYPAYSYIVSAIPSEVRKLMMLRRKLRSLDANVTGNVKQSAKSSAIMDKDGNEIEDMTNKYGYEVLKDFLRMAGNEQYEALVEKKWYDNAKSPDEKFEDFLREIEKLPCAKGDTPETQGRANQEDFYNRMNAMYVDFKQRKIEADEWDLDTSIESLKASTLNKKILFLGNNDNEFTKSVYIEDKWITPKGKPYTKEELEDKMVEFAGTKDFNQFSSDLVDEFDAFVEKQIAETIKSMGEADVSNAKDEEDAKRIVEEHKQEVADRVIEVKHRFNVIRKPLTYFKPNKIVQYPTNTDGLENGAWDRDGNRVPLAFDGGKFVGFKFLSKSEKKFSPMNIELHFASTSRIKPHIKITLTNQFRGVLEWIMNPTGNPILTNEQLLRVTNWVLGSTLERDKMRIFTGELFKAFEMSEDIFRVDPNYERKKRLIKFTTSSGNIETGVKLWLKHFIPLTKGETPVFTPIGSEAFRKVLDGLKDDEKFWLPSRNEYFTKSGKLFEFNLCKGIYPTKNGRKWRSSPDKIYLSLYANQLAVEDIQSATGVKPNTEAVRNVDMLSSGTSTWFHRMQFISFPLTGSALTKLLEFFDGRYRLLAQIMGTGAESEFVVMDLPDTYKPKKKGEEEEGEEAGEYHYYPSVGYNEKDAPPNYISGSFKKSEENEFGVITLRFPLTVIEAGLFSLFPVDITVADAVRSLLNAIQEDETRLKYIEEVKALKDDYIEIADITQRTVKINPRYAFGRVGAKYIGKCISEYIHSPKEAEKKKVESKKADEHYEEAIPMSWDTVQEFVTKLKSI